MATHTIRYTESGYTFNVEVERDPGQTLVEAIMQTGQVQFEWELATDTHDWCPVCGDYTEYDSDTCKACGRQWGSDY